jgi:hypothetical protein
LIWAVSDAVTDDVAGNIGTVLAGEDRKPMVVPGWRPTSTGLLLELLGEQGAPDGEERGPSFVLVDVPKPVTGVDCWTSTCVDRGELHGLMPEADRRSLVAPWAVAVTDGEVAAVCETARSGTASVEAGVWTYERFRRRGFATAAAAAWSSLVAERVVFYSTAFDNLASQRIAHKLGFQLLGHWWWIPHRTAS